MIEIKCPIHNTELAYLDEGVYGHTGCHMTGNKELWQELIRTRKALDVAVDAVKKLEEKAYLTEYAQGVVDKALKEITALEQKDVK